MLAVAHSDDDAADVGSSHKKVLFAKERFSHCLDVVIHGDLETGSVFEVVRAGIDFDNSDVLDIKARNDR